MSTIRDSKIKGVIVMNGRTRLMKKDDVNRISRKDIRMKSIWVLYLFLVPATVLTFVFSYIPMFTNIMAFQDYRFSNGWLGLGSPFVGFKNFSFLKEWWFWELTARTLTYSVTILVTSFPLPLILALLLNELRSNVFKKYVQTVSYIPHFVSWVTVAGLFYLFLSVDPTGAVNNIKQMIVGGDRISYMQESWLFLPLLVISGIWKELGWGTIIYLAAITNISPELYEAAEVDGANRWQRMKYITFPGLISTFCILLIFNLGGLLNTNFDQVFNFQNQVLRETTDTINIWVFYKGIRAQLYAQSSAVALFNGLVTFILTMTANYVTKKLNNTAII